MKSNDYSADLEVALTLADRADKITQDAFGKRHKIQLKSDESPVSDIDQSVEKDMRDYLAKELPTDAIVGEEYGSTHNAQRQWIIDPIDGTKNYIHDNPFYATLIALQENGKTIVAVVSSPMLQARWWATKGGGSWRNNKRIHTSDTKTLDSAYLTFSSLRGWRRIGQLDIFLQLYDECARQRAFGDFYNFMLVAEGGVDIAIEPSGLYPWDIAAPRLIVEEAGGQFTTISPLLKESALATNSTQLHHQCLNILNP